MPAGTRYLEVTSIENARPSWRGHCRFDSDRTAEQEIKIELFQTAGIQALLCTYIEIIASALKPSSLLLRCLENGCSTVSGHASSVSPCSRQLVTSSSTQLAMRTRASCAAQAQLPGSMKARSLARYGGARFESLSQSQFAFTDPLIRVTRLVSWDERATKALLLARRRKFPDE
jgi:hypothetical protein